MAIYKIFPEKDATLYSFYPSTNTGLDEILEISTFTSAIGSSKESSRAVMKFSTSEIVDIIDNKVTGSSYKAYLKLNITSATELPADYTLYCYPISGSWDMGTGRLANYPKTEDGVSWNKKKISESWPTGSLTAGVTSSYSGSTSIGGGTWYTGSAGINLEATQSFSYNDNKDIELNVTTAVAAFYGFERNPFAPARIKNDGFILKNSIGIEFNTGSAPFELKYFSTDTHTIYPPCLEIRWDDSSYVTGSLVLATSDKTLVSVKNNKGKFQQDSVNRFRLGVRDQYPPRTFQTTYLYLTDTKVLPSASYWAVKDLDTDEWVIDFDTSYTKISADSTSNYFDIYMTGLQPERFYKIIIKSIIGKSTIIFDEDYIFKVIR
jgi:hypothetical protein